MDDVTEWVALTLLAGFGLRLILITFWGKED